MSCMCARIINLGAALTLEGWPSVGIYSIGINAKPVGGMNKNYNTLKKTTYGVWVKAMGGYWKLAWAIALRFIASLITRCKERIAYAPGGTKMNECVRMWSDLAAFSLVKRKKVNELSIFDLTRSIFMIEIKKEEADTTIL